jgi:hypothetical protein
VRHDDLNEDDDRDLLTEQNAADLRHVLTLRRWHRRAPGRRVWRSAGSDRTACHVFF